MRQTKIRNLKTKSRNLKTRKSRKNRNVKGGAGFGSKKSQKTGASGAGGGGGGGGGAGASEVDDIVLEFGRSLDEKYPLLNDLLEEITKGLIDQLVVEGKIFNRSERDIILDNYYKRQIRLSAIAVISQLDDGSPEADHKQEVIDYLRDQQAKDVAKYGLSEHNLIQPDDITETIEAMTEEYDEVLDNIKMIEIQAIIHQYMQRTHKKRK